MQWECHSCGVTHPDIPEACRSCGTRPDIVKNVWRCAYCREAGNDCTQGRCRGCGRDRDSKDEVAVAPEQKVEGAYGRALASGDWLVCAWCSRPAPPVRGDCKPPENCEACGGPLEVATKKVAREEVSEADARTYAAPQVEPMRDPAGSPRTPQDPSRTQNRQSPASTWDAARRNTVALVVLASVAAALALYSCVSHYSKNLDCTVIGRQWVRTVEVQRANIVPRQGWRSESSPPLFAVCSSEQMHGTRRVRVGSTTTYKLEDDRSRPCNRGPAHDVSDRVPDGQVCTGGTKWVKNGGVSTKKCAGFSTRYRIVTRSVRDCVSWPQKQVPYTTDKYAEVPFYDRYCTWSERVWTHSRTLRASAWDDSPRWPQDVIGPDERRGESSESYLLSLSCPGRGNAGPLSHSVRFEDWMRWANNARVVAHMWGDTVTELRPR